MSFFIRRSKGGDSITTYETIAEAKSNSYTSVNQYIYIEEISEMYYTVVSYEDENPPNYTIIEPDTVVDNIKLKKTSSVSLNMHRDDDALIFEDNVSIGSVNYPKETLLGEGYASPSDILVVTYDGITYNNVSDIAISSDGSSFSFANNATGNTIFVSSDLSQNNNKYKIKGLEVKLDQSADYTIGSLRWDFWNGTGWQEFNIMSVDDEFPFYSNSKNAFTSELNEQIYFDSDIEQVWVSNDPIPLAGVSGVDRFWIRISISSPLSQLPEIERIRIHTSKVKMHENGFRQLFGTSRAKVKLDWKLNDLSAANDAPVSTDLYIGDNLAIGAIQNFFANGTTDRSGISAKLPSNIDTSSKIKVTFTAISAGTSLGDIFYTIRYGYSNNSTFPNVYTSAAAAPSTSPNQVTSEVIDAAPSQFTLKSYEAYLDVSSMNGNPNNDNADIIWISFERRGAALVDSHNDNIALVDFSAEYVAWCDGIYTIDPYQNKVVALAETWESNSFVTNGWTVVPSVETVNTWEIGTAQVESGTYGCYVSNDSGLSANYSPSGNANNSITHLYTDVVIPSGATIPTLLFNYKCEGEEGYSEDTYDFMKVYVTSTGTTISADTQLVGDQVGLIKYVEQSAWKSERIVLPDSVIGTTIRLVFSFQSDEDTTNPPAACLDNVQIIYFT